MFTRVVLAACLLMPLYAAAQLPDFTEIVQKEGPAVVNVSTAQFDRNARPALPKVPEDDPFYEFFKRFIPHSPPRELPARSLGSGFVASPDGYILTNAHVVEDADEITVKLTDKRELRARLVGMDKRTDIALLKINAKGLPTVRFGDPSKLKVGEWVVAIGSPFGFENTVTAGIVSGKGRSLPQENLVPFIQTDVPVNPGNSGGPLFNLKGEVVGINSQIYSRTGGFMGLSFAIPIDVATAVAQQLKATGKVTRGRIGVVIQPLTRELAEGFGLRKAQGALINSVERSGPADKAGVRPGDVILRFDGQAVNSSEDLPRVVSGTKPGARVSMQIWRNQALHEVQVTVGLQPDTEGATPSRLGERLEPATPSVYGMALSELSDAQRKVLGVEAGVLVGSVRGAAARAGIRQGDVILAVNQRHVKSVGEFKRMIGQVPKSGVVALLVRRGANSLYIPFRPDAD